jgi:hypothetical protein
MSPFNSKNWMVSHRTIACCDAGGMIFCSSKKLVEEHFFKKWLGIYKLFSSLSPSREQIGVKS